MSGFSKRKAISQKTPIVTDGEISGSVISTVGLLNAATQGSVDFYLLVSTLP